MPAASRVCFVHPEIYQQLPPHNCCRFARDNCPSYLVEKNFDELKAGRLDGLNIFSGTFMDAVKQRQYSKVGSFAQLP